ncbi:response regulator [Xanthomonas campestris]|uniref:response regulator n=1 Tax=Xanthomonas campestris TaxID=339 RepID=UPI0005AF349D|nr:response regulator transcription factor [Xanthomonas campestris]KIQ21611.1 LuxR family transcriptional regulator [Xanthomonas campestris]
MADTTRPTAVLVVDDHPLLRDGLSAMLGAERDMQVVGEAEDGEQAVDYYTRLRPDVVLMDLQMPRVDGVQAIQRIRQLDPMAKVIVLTTYTGDVRAVRALQAGAYGYLLKSALRRELVDTIRDVRRGQRRHVPASVAENIAAHVLDDALSARETEVLNLVATGCSNKQIGNALGISEETVKAHMKNILCKLGVRDRTHAVTVALRRGILSLET